MSTDSPAGRMRASDAEREQFAQIVREATGDGRLTLDEGEERLATIYGAKYRDVLRPIVADLPAGAVEPARGRTGGAEAHPQWAGPRWAGPRWGERPPPGAFARHLVVVTLISAALVGLWALSGAHFFWPAIPLIFFAFGLVRHARWAGWSRGRGYRGSYRG